MSSETFLLEAGLARAGCLGLCLGGFWASPRTETPELLSPVPVFEGRLLATFATGAHCCLTLSLVSTRTPHIFSCKVYQQVRPSLLWSMGFFIPSCRTLHFLLLNVVMFLWDISLACWSPSEQQLNYPLHQALLPSVSLMRVCSVPSSSSVLSTSVKVGSRLKIEFHFPVGPIFHCVLVVKIRYAGAQQF